MTPSAGDAPPLSRALSTACGLAMAAAAGFGATGIAAVAALLAAVAVLVGIWWRATATAAVLLAVGAIGIADVPTVPAAVAGLTAVGYLVLRHSATVTAPTVIFAIGFSFAGLVATVFPWSLPWLPLLAPFAALGLYAVAAQPFLGSMR